MVISRVTIRVTPFSALITLLITYLLNPLPLQVLFRAQSDDFPFLVNKILLSPIRENIKCPKALPSYRCSRKGRLFGGEGRLWQLGYTYYYSLAISPI